MVNIIEHGGKIYIERDSLVKELTETALEVGVNQSMAARAVSETLIMLCIIFTKIKSPTSTGPNPTVIRPNLTPVKNNLGGKILRLVKNEPKV